MRCPSIKLNYYVSSNPSLLSLFVFLFQSSLLFGQSISSSGQRSYSAALYRTGPGCSVKASRRAGNEKDLNSFRTMFSCNTARRLAISSRQVGRAFVISTAHKNIEQWSAPAGYFVLTMRHSADMAKVQHPPAGEMRHTSGNTTKRNRPRKPRRGKHRKQHTGYDMLSESKCSAITKSRCKQAKHPTSSKGHSVDRYCLFGKKKNMTPSKTEGSRVAVSS